MIAGFHGHDDAAVVRLDGDRALVQTVDFFTPIVDDPYDFGQIAAANSLSDIYAMGGEPLFALNIAAFPAKEFSTDLMAVILKGGMDKAREAGIPIVGGHTIDDPEPKYGLVVTGQVDLKRLVRHSGAQPGDVLVLTKPLGTGIISTAIKREAASETQIKRVTGLMKTLNERASRLMMELRVHAATDVTGYGFLGHLLELCQSSSVSAVVPFDELPFLDGVEDLAKQGVISGGTRRNHTFVKQHVRFDSTLEEHHELMAADAQTSGGLLIALPEPDARDFISGFEGETPFPAYRVGRIETRGETAILVTRKGGAFFSANSS